VTTLHCYNEPALQDSDGNYRSQNDTSRCHGACVQQPRSAV